MNERGSSTDPSAGVVRSSVGSTPGPAAAWLRDVPKAELATLHFGLRIAAQKPGMPPDEAEKLTRLADLAWDEVCRRSEADAA